MLDSSSFILAAVRLLSVSARRGTIAALVPVFLFLLCSETSFAFLDLMAAKVSASSGVKCSSSMASMAGALAACSSSSRSSASSLASISGSMKSATLCPSQISGMTSYFHSSFAKSHRFLTSWEYTPAPPSSSCKSFSVFFLSPASLLILASSTPDGMQGGLDTASRCFGIATCSLSATSWTRLLLSFTSTRLARSLSHATVLTWLTPSSVKVLIGTKISLMSAVNAAPAAAPAETFAASFAILSNTSLCSEDNSSTLFASILFITIITGLLANKGLIEWKSVACCSRVNPHCSEMSTT
mmetsp:Transcript_1039/g.2156  ORF Transcript_1039/g.2156 Transcript_1039/m.2156 type:complete len:299 (-) Transcript_1039:976-1872(-)